MEKLKPGKLYKVKLSLEAYVAPPEVDNDPLDKIPNRWHQKYNLEKDTVMVFKGTSISPNKEDNKPFRTDFIAKDKTIRFLTKKEDWYDHNMFDLIS